MRDLKALSLGSYENDALSTHSGELQTLRSVGVTAFESSFSRYDLSRSKSLIIAGSGKRKGGLG